MRDSSGWLSLDSYLARSIVSYESLTVDIEYITRNVKESECVVCELCECVSDDVLMQQQQEANKKNAATAQSDTKPTSSSILLSASRCAVTLHLNLHIL